MDWKQELNMSNLFTITSFLLGIMAFLIVVGILSGASQSYYDLRVGGLMYFLLLTMSACLLLKNYGRALMTYLVGASFFISLFLFFISPFKSFYVDTTVPLIILGFFASISEIYRNLKSRNLLQKIKNISPHIIHISVIILVLGILVSSVYVSKDTHSFTQEDNEWNWQGYKIEYLGYQPRDIEYGETYNFNFRISENGEFKDEIAITGVNKSGSTSWRPGLYSGLTEDVYLSLRSSTSQGITINAQISPYMSLLWIGVILFAVGIILRMTVPLFKFSKGKDKEVSEEREEKDHYDEVIEEELEKLREEKTN